MTLCSGDDRSSVADANVMIGCFDSHSAVTRAPEDVVMEHDVQLAFFDDKRC